LTLEQFAIDIGISNERTVAILPVMRCGNSIHLKLTRDILGVLGLNTDEGEPILPNKVVVKYINGNIYLKSYKEGDYAKT